CSSDLLTVKYVGSNGRKVWSQAHRGERPRASEQVYDIAADPQGNAIVTGWSSTEPGISMYTAKYAAADGAVLWERFFPGAKNSSYGTSVETDGAGNVFALGITRSDRSPSNDDCYTVKYSPDG